MKKDLEFVVEEVRAIRRKLWEGVGWDMGNLMGQIEGNPRIREWRLRNRRACAVTRKKEAEQELVELKRGE